MKFDMHIILYFFICMLWCVSVSGNGGGGGGDLQALLSIKAHIDFLPGKFIYGTFGRYPSWNVSSYHFCNWTGVSCGHKHQRVVGLDLSSLGLRGTLSASIGNLTFLRELDISSNSFTGTIPPSIGNLTFLRELHLFHNYLSGSIPQEITQLTRLQVLDLSSNSFTGTIPAEIGSLRNLQRLYVFINQLSGTIPPSIGNLTFLREILLYKNYLSGSIPQEITQLTRLQDLVLFSNSFTGTIPVEIGSLANLQWLDVSINQLSGTIPPSIGNLTFLLYLQLDNNYLSGSILQETTQLTRLQDLILSYNSFTGTIPAEISPNLQILDVGQNQLSGTIQPFIWNLSTLTKLDLSYNNFNGSIPWDFGLYVPNLEFFFVANNRLTGHIPPSITNASELNYLDISFNHFYGQVPMDLGHLSGLQQLDFSNNLIVSTIKDGLNFITSLTNCTQLGSLDLSSNNLRGMLPNTIANFSYQLYKLRLDENNIYGGFPDGLENLISLGRLNLSQNSLTGTIPDSIGKVTSLQELYLSNNMFSGGIPSTIGNLALLSTLALSGNMFSGGIPSSLSNCTKLFRLDLSRNKLTKSIPRPIFGLTSLVYLSFAHNNLSGCLPVNVGNLIMLTIFDVSDNNLSGELPYLLSSWESLDTFSIQSNYFTGSIPQSLAEITGIQRLDLSSNNLTGGIPADFTWFTSIQFLNLSHNSLEGEVPSEGLFKNSTTFSIAWNGNLCGGIKSLNLPQCPKLTPEKQEKLGFSIVMVLPAVFVVGFILIAYACVFYIRTRRSTSLSITEPMNSPLGEQYPRLSYAQLLQSTNRFSPDNLIGTGRYSWVYKGILTQYEQGIAIKVIKLDQSGAGRSFVSECEALKNIRHRNLVKIITACSGTDFKGNEFKALVYGFMSNGNLDSWLHPISSDEPVRLNLIQRLNIAIDVASVLVYLHHGCEIPIIHRDIKPSNILLDDDFCAHLGDFGSARSLLNPTDRTSGGRIHPAANEIVGTVGYIALEYAVGARVSTLVDVYSYGVVLLEMFSGKRPTDPMFKDEFSLHNYVKMSIPDQVMCVADPRLFTECENNPFRISGEAMRRNAIEVEKGLASVFEVGVICSSQSLKDRMEIADVLVKLETARNALSKLL